MFKDALVGIQPLYLLNLFYDWFLLTHSLELIYCMVLLPMIKLFCNHQNCPTLWFIVKPYLKFVLSSVYTWNMIMKLCIFETRNFVLWCQPCGQNEASRSRESGFVFRAGSQRFKSRQVKSETMLPTARHCCKISLKGAVLRAGAMMTRRWAPAKSLQMPSSFPA